MYTISTKTYFDQENEYITLEQKLDDLRRKNESLMVEKGEKMNHLAHALEESQAQCQNLMSSNNGREILQLQMQLKTAMQEREGFHKSIQDLQVRY